MKLHRRARPLGARATAAAVAGLALLPAAAAAVGEPQIRQGRATYDQRAAAASAGSASVAPQAAARTLARQLGTQGVVELDPVTQTPRRILRTDGALTRASADSPAAIALRWVRQHRDLFGLSEDDLAALGTPKVVVSPAGIASVRWTQRFRGIPVAGAELRAHVARDGRLLAVLGSPVADAAVPTTAPRLSASAALQRSRRDAGAGGAAPAVSATSGGAQRRTAFADDSDARLVVYAGPRGNRLAWRVTAKVDSTHVYAYTVDAESGAVLTRDNMVRFADSGHGAAWEYAPNESGAPVGGMVGGWQLAPVTFPEGWITSGGSSLRGQNAHVFPDVLDRDEPIEGAAPEEGGEVPATSRAGELPVWGYPFVPITQDYVVGDPEDPDDDVFGGWNCSLAFPCSWSSWLPSTWRPNVAQNAVQVFAYVNRFHDHLAQDPIGFDAESGAFEGGDPVIGHASDGAGIDAGYVDADHVNNANMWTPADGRSPVMQMYLFTADAEDPDDPTVDANGGDDASVVYHEYVHGLSNRLVTTEPGGPGALSLPQAGAMGEAWSDWYAMDYLVQRGFQAEDPDVPGEIVLAAYLSQGRSSLRFGALDCPVGAVGVENCPAGGGFTYADYGSIWSGGPEVHADGEIWAQTLWDLRTALIAETNPVQGVHDARLLVTEAMRMAPPEPSFLDMRDAILLADQRRAGGTYASTIWEVFAERGMGYFASALDASDVAPIADRSLPPAGAPDATLEGVVTDAQTGAPLPDATVRVPGRTELLARTDANGRYALTLHQHEYPRLAIARNGYDAALTGSVNVTAGANTRNLTLVRNWALRSGATEVAGFSGPDYTALGCGPEGAIDGSSATGWGSFQPEWSDPGNGIGTGPRVLELRLPATVDVSRFAIDPGAVCGDDDSAALADFRIETSADGATFVQAAAGTFGPADNGRRNDVALNPGTGAATRYVRIVMERPQGPTDDPSRSAWSYMDMAELAIYGSATRPVDPPDPPDPPDPGPPPPPPPVPDPPTPPAPRPPDPGPRPRPGPSRDVRRPKITRALVQPKARGAVRALRSRAGLRLQLRCDEACGGTVLLTIPASTARRLGLTRARRGNVLLARAKTRGMLKKGRTATLRFRLTRPVAQRIPARRALRVTFSLVLADGSANVTRKTVRPLLKP